MLYICTLYIEIEIDRVSHPEKSKPQQTKPSGQGVHLYTVHRERDRQTGSPREHQARADCTVNIERDRLTGSPRQNSRL
jgi:hypothetical protein